MEKDSAVFKYYFRPILEHPGKILEPESIEKDTSSQCL